MKDSEGRLICPHCGGLVQPRENPAPSWLEIFAALPPKDRHLFFKGYQARCCGLVRHPTAPAPWLEGWDLADRTLAAGEKL